MALKLYLVLSGVIFLVVAGLHLCRIIFSLSILVGPYTVPMGLSFLGFPATAGFAAWAGWLLLRRRSAV